MVDVDRAARAARGVGGILSRRSVWPPVRFLLLTPGRSGSTLLMSLLSSVPGVRSDQEVLRTSSGDPVAALARRAARAALGGVRAWGTSVHPEHLLPLVAGDPVAWVRDRHDAGYELVSLRRRNPLEHALSAAIAWERGDWHRVEGAPARTEAVRLDPVAVLREVRLADEAASEVETMVADRSHVSLVYEHDLRDAACHQATVDRVLGFLGVPTAPVSTSYRRRDVPLLEQVANADEIVAALRATRFAPFVDEAG